MASIRTVLLGTAPNRRFVIEWQDVAFCCISEERVRFEVILHEDGRILMQYTSVDENERESGRRATVGIENETSSIALQYSHHQTEINNNLAVRYIPPPMGTVRGQVTDAHSATPIAGATIAITELGITLNTDSEGRYQALLPVKQYTFTASAFGYEAQSAAVTVVEGGTTTLDFRLIMHSSIRRCASFRSRR